MRKPKRPGRYVRCKFFPSHTSWDPKKPVSAVDNQPPEKMWPIKEGSPVFYVKGNEILAAHVSWWNPARQQDACSLVSVGKPFFNLQHRCGSVLVSEGDVFPYTTAGWNAALKRLAATLREDAKTLRLQAMRCIDSAIELESRARAIEDK